MSGIVKGIKKVFKAVVKVVKKVAPIVLAVGALVFTGGAALGLTGMAGGWSGAVSALTAKLGAGSILTSALTGAITQAGTGALIGGAASALSGGSFSEGARGGAMAGAVTGGLLGTVSGVRGAATDALSAPGGQPGIGDGTGAGGAGSVKTYPYSPPQVGAGTPIDAGGNVIAPAASGSRGLLSGALGPGGWVERNQELVGGLVSGVGAGLLGGANADADRDLLRERNSLIAANYRGADPGARYRSAAPGTSGLTPTQRFNPSNYGSWEYAYNPTSGRIERVEIGG